MQNDKKQKRWFDDWNIENIPYSIYEQCGRLIISLPNNKEDRHLTIAYPKRFTYEMVRLQSILSTALKQIESDNIIQE